MTSRERLLASFRGDPVDRIPWSPCVDTYFLSSLPADQKLDEQEFHEEIGADAILRHVMLYESTAPATGAKHRNPRVDSRMERLDDGTLRFTYETKVGSLVEELKWDPTSPFVPWFTKRKLHSRASHRRRCVSTFAICSSRSKRAPGASINSSWEAVTQCRVARPYPWCGP
jgi:hypothetical protein